jgi:ribosome maturation factor RimP
LNTDTAAEIVGQVTRIAGPILQESALELVDIEFQPLGRRWLLRIHIDKEDGVTLADCERVSREMDRLLDVEDIIDHPYVLEISSPGLTRRLKRKADFERANGKMCRIVTGSVVDGKNEFRGEIIRVADDEVEVREDRDIHRIPLSVITKANLEFEL